MPYEPLHHKYRPQTFAELVGQESVTTTLTNALRQQRIAPAYLFTGARGTGKTSSARILAKSLNCLNSSTPTHQPCGKCEVCRMIANGSALDVIEIDAASNTGVDNIRELIERAQFAPVQCRYKVYVVDECLTGDSLVLTEQGLVRIDDPTLKDKRVLSYNDALGQWEFKPVVRWLDQGKRQTYFIRTSNREIRCTGNHLIRTEQGWIAAKDVKEGMKILSPAAVDVAWLSSNLAPMVASADLLEGNRVTARPTTTSGWEQIPPEHGSPIFNNIQSRQWITNLETVESVRLAGIEQVYDIEVEDNHNFVANGLLVHNCHMLSTAAFNALLKTLEEPPDRVVFVLATTDPQRVLPTIISRCQRFDFRRIPLDAMVQHLSKIAAKEAIDITPEAIQLVAQISQGGLRDAQSLLDQLSLLDGQITAERVWDLVGAVPERDLLALVQAIVKDDATTVIDRARRLMDRGREPLIVLQNLASFYRDLLIAKTSPARQDLIAVTPSTWAEMCEFTQPLSLGLILQGQQHLRESEGQVKNTTQPRLWLEVALLGLLPSAIGSHESGIRSQELATHSHSRQSEAPSRSPEIERKIERNGVPVPQTGVRPQQKVEHQTVPPAAEFSAPRPLEPTPAEQPKEQLKEQPEVVFSQVQPEIQGQPGVDRQKFADIQEEPIAPLTAPPTPQLVEPTISTSAVSNTIDLEQVWQDVIAQIKFRGTQVLLQQQSFLLAFDGKEARIGIKSQPLFQMAKKQLLNIENAFESVYQQKIRISLEVTTTAEASSHVDRNAQSNGSGTSSPPRKPIAKEPPASSAFPAKPNQPARTAAIGSDLLGSPEVSEPVSSTWREEDEVKGAARSVAQFFNGEIVSLEDELSIVPPDELVLTPETTTVDEVDGDPDEDVPF